jgi:hypothetical protein
LLGSFAGAGGTSSEVAAFLLGVHFSSPRNFATIVVETVAGRQKTTTKNKVVSRARLWATMAKKGEQKTWTRTKFKNW